MHSKNKCPEKEVALWILFSAQLNPKTSSGGLFFFNFLVSLFRNSLFYVREARAEYGMKIAEKVELKLFFFNLKTEKWEKMFQTGHEVIAARISIAPSDT